MLDGQGMRYQSMLLVAATVLVSPVAAIADSSSYTGVLGELKFQFDSAALPADAPGALAKVAASARANPDVKIVLDAHADPIGASDYNVGLSIRRAESVQAQLQAIGVDDDQIVLAVYGEDGERRASFAEDRRVTIWSTRQPLANIIDYTFLASGDAVKWQRPLTVAQIDGTSSVASR